MNPYQGKPLTWGQLSALVAPAVPGQLCFTAESGLGPSETPQAWPGGKEQISLLMPLPRVTMTFLEKLHGVFHVRMSGSHHWADVVAHPVVFRAVEGGK